MPLSGKPLLCGMGKYERGEQGCGFTSLLLLEEEGASSGVGFKAPPMFSVSASEPHSRQAQSC